MYPAKIRHRCLYLLGFVGCIICITLLSRQANLLSTARWKPFWSYYEWITGRPDYGISIILNIGLFFPFGYMVADLLESLGLNRPYRMTLIASFALSITIEALQFFTGRGLCDVDDVINNCIGSIVGCVLYCKGEGILPRIQHSFPALLLVAGIIGCFMTTLNITSYSAQKYILQFDFEICSVSANSDELRIDGICYIYGKDTPEYQILLRETTTNIDYKMNTVREGNSFVASAGIDFESEYEVDVLFLGFEPLNTFTYIDHGSLRYIASEAKLPSIQDSYLSFLNEDGILKAYNPDFKTYVYQVDSTLYWLVGDDIDSKTEIIYQIHTDEKELLSEDRKKYGFDNQALRAGDKNEMEPIGQYKVFCANIPESYHVTAIMTGFSVNGKIKWSYYFRV